jgi:hypothetical protein
MPPTTSETIATLELDILQLVTGVFTASPKYPDGGTTEKYSEWYLGYLKCQISRLIQRPNLQELLMKIYPQNEGLLATQQELSIDVLRCLKITASVLRSDRQSIADVALQIVGGDRAHGLLQNADSWCLCQQFAFELVALVTMLYTPASNPEGAFLELSLDDPVQAGRPARSYSWKRFQCEHSVGSNLPLNQLLCRFGAFVPHTLHKATNTVYGDKVLAANLSYYTLLNVGRISIFWVDSISLHLEFDERTLQLKLFRHPSICAMICESSSKIHTSIFAR